MRLRAWVRPLVCPLYIFELATATPLNSGARCSPNFVQDREHQGHPCRCLHCASTVSPPGPSTARRRRARSDVDIQSLTSSDDSQSRQHSPSVSTSSSDIGPMFPPIPAPDAIGPRERGRIPTAEPEGYPVQDFEPRSHSGFTPNGRPFAYQYPVIGSSHCPPPSQPYPSPTPRATTRSRHVIERLDVGLGLHGASAHRSRPMYTLPRPTLPALSTQNWYTPYSHHRCPPQPRIPYICRSATPVQRSCSPPCILPPLSSSSSSYASLSQRSMSVEPACTEEATVTMPFPSPPPPPKYRIIRWGPNGRQEGDALS
ncbi:hypothetical protein CYLTODRAFT_258889 [Cylindrobasidium torrendii FP15055 ss-10]|uniref:Uncharacterized protein n=1 Tax=Cylindrobasidium torrendii FP15055 ss-10 TaxID=1314674 RepID=A0A0D7BG12_9AGAR|nr:hypothetical protein CYLTODRAFT_258889 [Cylindrobasidium torrendii FP15055 ss-10]